MSTSSPTSLYTIEAGAPFADDLAAGLFKRYAGEGSSGAHSFQDIQILLPTRRACRVLQDAFLRLNPDRSLILPQIQAIGDVDEDALLFEKMAQTNPHPDASLDIPAAIAPLKRQILLAKLISQLADQTGVNVSSFDHSMELASLLTQFMDQVHTENLSLSDLPNIVPEEFADHWNITLKFITILSNYWPKILNEYNVIDPSHRRDILIRSLTSTWQHTPPSHPVIVAGTTGSIPAAGDLLKTIATLPQGCVVLPGLDNAIDDDDWNALDETHPQYGFKHILQALDLEPSDIPSWTASEVEPSSLSARRNLARELMRPQETSYKWTKISQNNDTHRSIESALNGVEFYDCDSQHHEAMSIALIIRKTLDTPDQTIALITPDRHLADLVHAICKRWGLNIDDSAGRGLHTTAQAELMRAVCKCIYQDFSPVALLTVLKHPLCRAGLSDEEWMSSVYLLERHLLRGAKPKAGLEGLYERLESISDGTDTHRSLSRDSEAYLTIKRGLDHLTALFQPFYDALNTAEHSEDAEETGDYRKNHSFKSLMTAHLALCETLATTPEQAGAERLWHAETGEAVSITLSHILDHSALMPNITLEVYQKTLDMILSAQTIRPRYGTHPRAAILGQLEARLISADRIIMGGLNEGVWPATPAHDPWMSRPMRKTFGLPLPERSTGLSAHDFVQGFCHPDVIMTRCQIQDQTPCVPARWVQRLDTVLKSCELTLDALKRKPYMQWAHHLNTATTSPPIKRPEPRPPAAMRPKALPVTRIETWLKDPYSVYARDILKLKPLDALEMSQNAAQRGTFIHAVLHKFNETYKTNWSKIDQEQKYDTLLSIAKDEASLHYTSETEITAFWPRFERLAAWYINAENTWRKQATPYAFESKGQITLEIEVETEVNAKDSPSDPLNPLTFDLHARADRIDRMHDGSFAVLDYKTGGSFTQIGMIDGSSPQLILEALILEEGGFTKTPQDQNSNPSHLAYWVMTGGRDAGTIIAPKQKTLKDLDFETLGEAIDHARQGLKSLIACFSNDNTPYYSQPDPAHLPRFNDYEHLARVQEWDMADESDDREGTAS